MPAPHDHRIDDDARIGELLRSVRTIAVLGIKTEAQSDQPAYYVPAFAQRAGFEVIPVPVYYPEVREILGRPVFRTLASITTPVDMVNVFRRPGDVPAHLDDILAARPRVVWMQLGIRNEAVADRLADAGIDVVQDRCLMVELRRHGFGG
jgi:hypothetical protein